MSNLTKLQLTLLAGACQRPEGSLLPVDLAFDLAPNRARKAAGQLIGLGFATEYHVTDHTACWRKEGGRLIGAIVTDAGRRHVAAAEADTAPPASKQKSKNDVLIELLSRPDGVSLDELVAATQWQRHTTRAAITILKNRNGRAVERFGEHGASRYRIAGGS